MDGFMTDEFFEKLPKNLRSILFDDSGSYFEFYRALKGGILHLGVSGEKLFTLLEELNQTDPDLSKKLISFVDSGKLKGLKTEKEIHPKIDLSGIRKGVLRQLSGCYEHDADTLIHDELEQKSWIEKLEAEGQKPLFLDENFTNGNIEYLFKEQSKFLNVGDPFNWSRFLMQYVLPFNRVRILDPFLFVNIRETDLPGILKSISKKSKHGIKVEIISDLSAQDKWTSKEVLERVQTELKDFKSSKIDIALYDQKGGGKDLFHKRVVWTDFWALYTDRGFDFLDIEKGGGTVKRENTLFISGKYASKDSVWHQIEKNWNGYLEKADLITS